MAWQIDGTLYPDVTPPELLDNEADRIDFIHRLCAAWDFGVLPDIDVIIELRRPEWRDDIDACTFLTSPTYHLLRTWHHLPPQPFLGSVPAYIRDDPWLDSV